MYVYIVRKYPAEIPINQVGPRENIYVLDIVITCPIGIVLVVGDTNCGCFFPGAYKIPRVSAVVEGLDALQACGYHKEAQWLETGFLELVSNTWLGLRERIRDPILFVASCRDHLAIAAPGDWHSVGIRPEHALLHVHHRVSVNAASETSVIVGVWIKRGRGEEGGRTV